MVRTRNHAWFLAHYALANAGGVLAYLPLLTLLLPLRIERIAAAHRLDVLTLATLMGAVSASVANIGFGALSDRTYVALGTRRPWIVAGLVATVASYGLIEAAVTPMAIVAAVMLFQAALNAMLAPLAAMMADEVPDTYLGVAGGLLAIAVPVASFAGGIVTGFGWLDDRGRLALICILFVACIMPLVVLGDIGPRSAVPVRPAVARPAPATRRDLVYVWAARLCIQIACSVLFTYLFFYFESIDGGGDPLALASRIGHMTGVAFLIAVPVALLVGRLSDRFQARKPFLMGAALLTAVALMVMATTDRWEQAAAGYALFAIGSATFLALHSTWAMQTLPDPRRRGRDLGLVNLANTLPALIGPGMTWLLIGNDGYALIFVVLASLTVIGGVMVLLTPKKFPYLINPARMRRRHRSRRTGFDARRKSPDDLQRTVITREI